MPPERQPARVTDAPARVASRIRLSYRAADAAGSDGLPTDSLVHERIQERSFRTYLRRVHAGEVTPGAEWAEFVNCGCGSVTDVVIRVDGLVGGSVLGDETEVELVPFEGEA